MPVPEFDINIFVKNALPPNYRLPKWTAAFQGFLSGLKWNWDRWKRYRNGERPGMWGNASTFGVGQRVQYQYAIWESQIDGNIGNQPTTSPTAWILYNKSAIGASERAKYTGRSMTLTYALNQYFKQELDDNGLPGFNNGLWPAPYDYGLGGGTWSSIYITTDPVVYLSFAGYTTPHPANIMYGGGTGNTYMFSDLHTAAASSYSFTIHVPAVVYAAIDATPTIADTIIRNFADTLVVVGLQYHIVSY